jgi:hypothetical protein
MRCAVFPTTGGSHTRLDGHTSRSTPRKKEQRVSQRLRIGTVLTTVAAALTLAGPASAQFAPAATAPVHPGVMTYTEGAQCTANFVFTDAAAVYIGQAAHCSGTGQATETNGCDAASLPLGTRVEVRGASRPGTLVYNSWIEMQENGEAAPDTCQYNDFALVRLDPADDYERTNPSVPFWGGPTGTSTTGTALGAKVLSYGNSSLRQGVTQLSPKEGSSVGTEAGGWNHPVYTLTPGVPGDSGSAFLDRQGRALGVLSTLALAPLPLSNGVSDLDRAVRYMEANTAFDVTLAQGTQPFRGGLLP